MRLPVTKPLIADRVMERPIHHSDRSFSAASSFAPMSSGRADDAHVADALRLSEERLRLALDAAQMGLWDIDLATGTRTESETMGPLFGRPIGVVNPDRDAWKEHIHPEDLTRITVEFSQAIQGLREYHTTYRTIGYDGVTRWIESRGRVVRDAEGRASRVVGVARDVTEEMRAAAEREKLLQAEKQARQQAEAASRAKDQFLAILSHELRTPLTPVLTLAQMLENDPALAQQVREKAATIRRNVELEARLIDDMLDLTRISRGKLLLHLSDVDVHEKLQHVAQICDADIRGNQLDLSMDLQAANRFVRADAARFQQVVWNLVKNSIKFTKAGGRITIGTRNDDDGKLIVTVSDTGIGIRPDQLAKIFKPFEQGDTSTTRLFGGLGLGLSISRALAEAHGGELIAQSEGEDKGATFTLRLPALIAPAMPPSIPSASRTTSYFDPRHPRILIVEDHADTGKALKILLTQFGYDVRVATTVASALQIAHAEKLDLLISDLGLPDGTGHDLMRQLLAKFSIRGIALSGYGMEEDIRRSHQSGFIEHLTKPIEMSQLRSAIDRVMNAGEDITIKNC
jgi:PAS domain S-box-containing protein